MTYAVIMAGGSGTRFWPLSRAALPKQLVGILSQTTMIQATVARLQPLIPVERVLIVTTEALAEETRRQLPMLAADQIIAEPMGRDTAAAVALAAMLVAHRDPEAAMVLLPADQVIAPADAFHRSLRAGIEAAHAGALVTFGITPRHAATGYGYIRTGETLPARHGCAVHAVQRFVEKPDAITAAGYLRDGGYLWNSGIFCWKAAVVLRELRTHCAWLLDGLATIPGAIATPHFPDVLRTAYAALKRISIDYALMERAAGIQVVTAGFSWDDVGAWDSLYDHLDGDAQQVHASGDVLAIDCQDSLIVNRSGALIAAVGVHNLSIVATEHALLIIPKGRSQEVKTIVDRLRADGRSDVL